MGLRSRNARRITVFPALTRRQCPGSFVRRFSRINYTKVRIKIHEMSRVKRHYRFCSSIGQNFSNECVIRTPSNNRLICKRLNAIPDSGRIKPCDLHIGSDRAFEQLLCFQTRRSKFSRKTGQNCISFENGMVRHYQFVGWDIPDEPVGCDSMKGMVRMYACNENAAIDADFHVLSFPGGFHAAQIHQKCLLVRIHSPYQL